MKKILLFSVLLALTTAFVGCETFKGVGQDIENTGKNIKDVVSGGNN